MNIKEKLAQNNLDVEVLIVFSGSPSRNIVIAILRSQSIPRSCTCDANHGLPYVILPGAPSLKLGAHCLDYLSDKISMSSLTTNHATSLLINERVNTLHYETSTRHEM